MPNLIELQSKPVRAAFVKTGVDSSTVNESCRVCVAYESCEEVRGRLGADARSAFSIPSSVYSVPARRIICHPNEWPDYVPMICEGWASSSIVLPGGRRQILAIYLPGDIMSSVVVVEPKAGRLVEAVTDVVYRRYLRSDLKALFAHPDLFKRFAQARAEEAERSDQLVVDLGRRTADERLARLILNIADRLAKRDMVRGQTMDFPLRQHQIANATGLTPVHVSKVLREFRRANVIEINSRSLTILDVEALRQIGGMH